MPNKLIQKLLGPQDPPEVSVPSAQPLNPSLEATLQEIHELIGHSSDIVIRRFHANPSSALSIAFIYIEGLVNTETVNQAVLMPLMDNQTLTTSAMSEEAAFHLVKDQLLPIGSVQEGKTLTVLIPLLFNGNTLIFFDGHSSALAADTAGWEKRSINEPTSQGVIRGPKEGFTESLRTGTAMLRRRLKTPDLHIEEFKIGQRTQTSVALAYLKGIANESVIEEIRRRLNSIVTDSILESNYIEEFIQDGGMTPFPTIQNTERPDAMAGGILEGQVGIIIDGTPFALLAPSTFFNFFQSSEDYYQRYDISSFLRMIRFAAFFVSMLLPALYIAVTTFHQEMLPTTLLISLAAQREGVPLPALAEALLMEITFDVLREAGVRMPRTIGPAISIVGALVLGQAAVQAGLVSAAMVIVVSFTAISNFVIPSLAIANSIRLIRFAMMLIAATLGLFGVMSSLIVLLIHMAGLRSFGVPYLSPIAPMEPGYMKDVFIRVPLWHMTMRPKTLTGKETRRQGRHQQPKPAAADSQGASQPNSGTSNKTNAEAGKGTPAHGGNPSTGGGNGGASPEGGGGL
ncbi:spore germination protein [Paenibacillus sp. NFR01]|uniref:spore germination protein n=1 Tax=Paenibacillus sp. NFR01 TaxID=1566279 RepID=UPI0008D54548|nr:spore germination protein [Paenibacillus sp. NFR01]SET97373.1 spore germination protein KA [Paenibacillus sp. NFR01]